MQILFGWMPSTVTRPKIGSDWKHLNRSHQLGEFPRGTCAEPSSGFRKKTNPLPTLKFTWLQTQAFEDM